MVKIDRLWERLSELASDQTATSANSPEMDISAQEITEHFQGCPKFSKRDAVFLSFLLKHGRPMRATELTEFAQGEIQARELHVYLGRLVKKGILEKRGDKKYWFTASYEKIFRTWLLLSKIIQEMDLNES